MNPFQVYSHLNPGRLLFGQGSLGQMDEYLPSREKTLIVSDPGVSAAGLVARAVEQLERLGVAYAVFDQVSQDAPLDQIEQAAQLYRAEGCGALMAVGGGSPMDAAKAIGVSSVSHDATICWITASISRSQQGPLPPLVAVPTTAGHRLAR